MKKYVFIIALSLFAFSTFSAFAMSNSEDVKTKEKATTTIKRDEAKQQKATTTIKRDASKNK